MLITTGKRGPRAFWAAVAISWIAMLAFTAATQAAHVLIVLAWGILVAALGIGLLVDHERAVRAYRRGMPASVSIAYVRGVVTSSGAILVVIGLLMVAVGGVRIWGALWADP